MAHITPEEIHAAYEQAKLFYNETITMKEAVAALPSLKPSTVKDFVYNYRQMRNGVLFQRGLSTDAIRDYLEGIHREHGDVALENALTSLKKHLEYDQTLGRNPIKQWELYREFFERFMVAPTPSTLQEDLHDIEISQIPPTVKKQLIDARLGQGVFREAVIALEKKCRVTGLADTALLIASHIKPWRDCDNKERLDGHNGLLLSPHIDKLFDKGLLSFQNDGTMLLHETARAAFECWNVELRNVGAFHANQLPYLEWHRVHYFSAATAQVVSASLTAFE